MKISKRTREQAALICAMWASSGDAVGLSDAQQSLGLSALARRVADLAWSAARQVPLACPNDSWRPRCAEAEAMLRTGWSP